MSLFDRIRIMGVKINIDQNTSGYDINKDRLGTVLANVASEVCRTCSKIGGNMRDIVIDIELTDDSRIAQLNKKYRNKDMPTDVLSFPADQIERVHHGVLGAIVCSLDTVARQAEEYETPFIEELFRVLIHGVLHLFGYEHEGVEAQIADEMFCLQDRLIKKHVCAY